MYSSFYSFSLFQRLSRWKNGFWGQFASHQAEVQSQHSPSSLDLILGGSVCVCGGGIIYAQSETHFQSLSHSLPLQTKANSPPLILISDPSDLGSGSSGSGPSYKSKPAGVSCEHLGSGVSPATPVFYLHTIK